MSEKDNEESSHAPARYKWTRYVGYGLPSESYVSSIEGARARWVGQYVFVTGMIYTPHLGGRRIGYSISRLEPESAKWVCFSFSAPPMKFEGMVLVDDKLLAVGGVRARWAQAYEPRKGLVFDLALQEVNELASHGHGPEWQHDFVCEFAETTRQVLVFGGRRMLEVRNDFFCLHADYMIWTRPQTKGRTPSPRREALACIVSLHESATLCVCGGFSQQENHLNDLHLLHVTHSGFSWSSPAINNPYFGRARMFVPFCGKALLLGGRRNRWSTHPEVFWLDIRTGRWERRLQAEDGGRTVSISMELEDFPETNRGHGVSTGNKIVYVCNDTIVGESFVMLKPVED